MTARALLATTLGALLAAASLGAALLPRLDAEPRLDAPRGTLQLVEPAWSLDGLRQPPPPRAGLPDDPDVRLPWHERGERWSFVFRTQQPGSARLLLDWTPGPEGLVFEIVIDGERLVPARDGWRPTPRRLRSDLGTRWLGAGRHLVEFVCRESGAGALQMHALELHAP